MVLSKPLFQALGSYMEQLYNHPVRTNAITCCILTTAGNYASQSMCGNKRISQGSLVAYGAFGLLFGGAVPHFFYSFLERIVSEDAAFPVCKKLLIDGLFYSPLYQAFMLYSLARLEGKDHNTAILQLKDLYWIILSSSWKYLTLVQLLNFRYIPPMMRVVIVNLITFFWTIYIANKRQQQAKKSKNRKTD